MELIVRDLAKRFGQVEALSGVSFTAGEGVLALLGPNGSGKSTLLRILATVSQPGAGEVRFGGRSYADDLRPVRRVLGYLPQEVELPGHLTPVRLLTYLAQLKGLTFDPAVLAELGLGDEATRRIGELSGGQVRRVGIAQALMGAPRLLVLDELTAGLDPEERDRVVRLAARPGRVVVISSHVPSEVEAYARQVVVLSGGRVRYAGGVDQLRRLAEGHVHEMLVPVAETVRCLSRCQVSRVTARGAQAVLRVVGDLPGGAPGLPVEPSLEDAYLWLQQGKSPLRG